MYKYGDKAEPVSRTTILKETLLVIYSERHKSVFQSSTTLKDIEEDDDTEILRIEGDLFTYSKIDGNWYRTLSANNK